MKFYLALITSKINGISCEAVLQKDAAAHFAVYCIYLTKNQLLINSFSSEKFK